MRKLALAAAATAAVLAGAMSGGTSPALAQRVDVGPGGIHIGPGHRHGCRTVTTTEWRNGVRVQRTVRRCGGHDWDER